MASPQKENGYIPIANEIAEILMRTQLTGYQNRILWAIWRKTYGFNKKEDWISNSQLVSLTGILKANICRTIVELKNKKIVIKNDNKISFNKDYETWKGVIKIDNKVIENDTHKRQYTKDRLSNDVKGVSINYKKIEKINKKEQKEFYNNCRKEIIKNKSMPAIRGSAEYPEF